MTPENIARAWWAAIDEGDYAAAADLLAPETAVDWPLSGERLPSPLAWQQVNEHYPSKTPWRATVINLVEQDDIVVTFTQVTDGHILDLAISHFRIEGGRIVGLTEYWPETYAAPSWRSAWSTPLPDQDNPLLSPPGVL
ncbi:MAG TPA: nuclear transport factor 2 family protein [Thermomicrobiales bacterium]|nr:nuclear transport factor 2 family protein [Thermomicrobiales bacterium]